MWFTMVYLKDCQCSGVLRPAPPVGRFWVRQADRARQKWGSVEATWAGTVHGSHGELEMQRNG